GELIQVAGFEDPAAEAAALERARRAAFVSLWKEAHREGHDEAWVLRRFVERHGAAPPADWPAPPRPAYDAAQKSKGLGRWMGVAHRQGFDHRWVRQKYRNKFGEEPEAAAAAPPAAAPAAAPDEAATQTELDF